MLNYIDLTIVLVIIASAILLILSNPNFRQRVIDEIKSHEADIVQIVWNRLPESVKSKVDSRFVAEIVESSIEAFLKILQEKLSKK